MRPTFSEILSFSLLVVFLLQGCDRGCASTPHSTITQGGMGRTGHYSAHGPKKLTEVVWKFRTAGAVHFTPAVWNETVYFGSRDGYFYAVDSKTGKEKWKIEVEGGRPSTSPAIYEEHVFFGGTDRYIHAVDAQSGQEKWRFRTEGTVWKSPLVWQDSVFFQSQEGYYYYAVNTRTGQERWKVAGGGILGQPPPAIFGEQVFLHKQYAPVGIDTRTGQATWSYDACQYAGHLAVTKNILFTSCVLVGGSGGGVIAVDISDKTLKWKYSEGSPSYLSVDSDSVYFVDSTAAADALLGTQYWELTSLTAATGKLRWKLSLFRTPDIITGEQVSLSGSTAYVPGSNGILYAVDTQKGTELWRFVAEGELTSPLVADGSLYFGSSDGYVYSLR